MVINKRSKAKKLYSALGVVMLSIVGVSTVLGNAVSATEVYPTITNTHQESNSSLGSVGDSLGEMFSQFVDFVKKGVAENNSKTKHTFDVAQDTDKVLNNIRDKFSDISDHPDKEYINFLSNQDIISSSSDKFNPENFIRLHEFTKILVNSYRLKLGYSLDKNIGLTNENYFSKTMPKYYNTAYEMGLLEGVYDIENFERFISYEDLKVILSNFKVQYSDLINLDYLDIQDSNHTLKRGDISRVVVNTLMLNNKQNFTFTDIASSKYSEDIEELAKLEIINTENQQFYPLEDVTRGDFIVMIVKSYLKSIDQKLIVDNMNFDVEDLDYNSIYAPYVIYAQENGLVDYLFETIRGKTYISLNQTISKHEVYHIVSKVAGVQINYDIGQADKELMSRGELTKIITDSFNFKSTGYSAANSQIEKFIDNVKSFTETKKLASLIF